VWGEWGAIFDKLLLSLTTLALQIQYDFFRLRGRVCVSERVWVCDGVCGCVSVSVGEVGSHVRRAAALTHHVSP